MEICDVTLREGDQMPGRSYTVEQKIEAGLVLDELGVPLLQAGFPVTGETDQAAVRRLSENADADVVALSRALPGDVDAAVEAGADVVEVFASLSELYLEYALDSDRDEMLKLLDTAVDRVRGEDTTVHVTLADAFRTDPVELVEVFDTYPSVDFINLADTVGARTPTSVESLLVRLAADVDLSRAGVHFHDDLGMASANALAAAEIGVGKVDVSVASLGERAGNPALEEVVVANHVEHDDDLGLQISEVIPACTAVLDVLGEDVEPRKAILGREVTQHESGIHTAAMLEEPSVFEPFSPGTYGGERQLLFGEQTGASGAAKLLDRAGIPPSDDRVEAFSALLSERGPLGTEAAIELARERFS